MSKLHARRPLEALGIIVAVAGLLFLFSGMGEDISHLFFERFARPKPTAAIFHPVANLGAVASDVGNTKRLLESLTKPIVEVKHSVDGKCVLLGRDVECWLRNRIWLRPSSDHDLWNLFRVILGASEWSHIGEGGTYNPEIQRRIRRDNVSDVAQLEDHAAWSPLRTLGVYNSGLCTNHLLPKQRGLIGNGFGGLLSSTGLFSDFAISLIHRVRLAIGGDGVADDGEQGRDLKNYFPPRRLIWAAVAAFAMALWGWFNLRRELNVPWGFSALVCGCALWGYTVNCWLNWWLG